MATVIDQIWVCRDCFDVANGNHADSEESAQASAQAVDALLAEYGSRAALVNETDVGDPFSKTPCECCRSTAYGERYLMAILV